MPIVAGAVADYVTEPAMQSSTWLANTFGWMVGTSPGSGMALQYLISGLAYIAVIVVAWFIPAVRHVEELLPDHDQLEKVEHSHSEPEPAEERSLQPAA
ncbi:MAG: hypothetical protein GWN76_21930 [candidate division Zixibacteria bacterium]|nr:hypothetical protein [candidate division Zixibacteria bacterium]NIU16592.1 hypothetical protein [candidate division Zixibacteria bacterium]NIW49197.1 hypothetical protein [Gammaproteobacteria bacterium]